MPTRRQEKVARIVREAVSDAIRNSLSDPRISGFISVTRVEMTPDLKNANVYLSMFGQDEKKQNKTFLAIIHAKSKIQSVVADYIQSKFCPVLHIKIDEKLKKTMDVINLINKAAEEYKDSEIEEGIE